MKIATVTESKNNLSELLRAAKAGHGVLILDRDVPVARLEPVSPGSLPDEFRWLQLERQGLIRRPQEAGSPLAQLAQLPLPKLQDGASATAALLAERDETR